MIDQFYVDGFTSPISREDRWGNQYTIRKLKDGRTYEIIKNFPRPGEPGAETWSPTDVPTGGGAVWTPFSLDPAEGLLFVATGNPAPDF